MNSSFDFQPALETLTPGQLAALGARVPKAVDLASTVNAIQPLQLSTTRFKVISQDPQRRDYYEVDLAAKSCTCKDSTHGHPCKHRLATWLYVTILQQRSAAPAVLPEVTREQVNHILASHGTAGRLLATHIPTGRRVELISYVKTEAPANNIGITAYFLDDFGRSNPHDHVTLAPRKDFKDLFIAN